MSPPDKNEVRQRKPDSEKTGLLAEEKKSDEQLAVKPPHHGEGQDPSKCPFHKAAPKDGSLFTDLRKIEAFIMPIVFTLIGAFIRLHKIGASHRVVWDEAHFGKFGSYYLNHTYYFDVHPPLGKMLCGLSGYIAGYNGSFNFASGTNYPDYLDYTTMRAFNAMFSIISVPTSYFTAKALGFSLPAVWLAATMVTFEESFAVLARFILLDSMLICFTTTAFLGLAKMHQHKDKPFTLKWMFWMAFTGASLGLSTGVKMVGLFVTSLVGLYVVIDLWMKLGKKNKNYVKLGLHLFFRVLFLIVLPILLFMAAFKCHFHLLYKTGDGVATMSSLFKANLEGADTFEKSPMDVAYGSTVTIKNGGMGGQLLHSHIQGYPEGSKQNQITTYGHMDVNNEWLIDHPRFNASYTNEDPIRLLRNGDKVRLRHKMTGRNLHSHEIKAPLNKYAWEVSGYGNDTIGDEKDNWIIEIVDSLSGEDPNFIHPMSTSMRLKHESLGCYLSCDGTQLPEWGFRQGEVVCLPNASRRNKATWWNVEQHWNERLPIAEDRVLPKSKFLADFITLNVAQMRSNNALVSDEDRKDSLVSDWWEWPITYRGLRMCGWGTDHLRYYLLGTPTTIWLTSLSLVVFVVMTAVYIIGYQRQSLVLSAQDFERFCIGAGLPFMGWLFHYLPFIIMGRITYIHHYMPALYFAIFLVPFWIDWFACPRFAKYIHGFLIVVTISVFYYFRSLVFGMEGPIEDYSHLQWFKTWHIV